MQGWGHNHYDAPPKPHQEKNRTSLMIKQILMTMMSFVGMMWVLVSLLVCGTDDRGGILMSMAGAGIELTP